MLILTFLQNKDPKQSVHQDDTSPVTPKFIYTSYININAIIYFYQNVDCDLLPVSLGLIIPLNLRVVLTTAL